MPLTLPPIVIRTVEARDQRYATVGDWVEKGDSVVITVSKLGYPDMEFLVAIHELVEWYLCQRYGIPPELVDAFDKSWKPHSGFDEPGNDPAAPYFAQHQFASVIEKTVQYQLGVWQVNYDRELNRAQRKTTQAIRRREGKDAKDRDQGHQDR